MAELAARNLILMLEGDPPLHAANPLLPGLAKPACSGQSDRR